VIKFKLPTRKPSENPARPKGWLANFSVIAGAILLALIITLFVFQSYRVDGESMENTLQNNDRLVIDKIPRTWSRITGHAYIPHRGDIIVFNEVGTFNSPSPESKQLIKRVIGLPGDRVVISGGQITIYNAANPSGFNPDMSGWSLADTNSPGDIDITLGPTQLFVSGDNRTNSTDSHIFGPIDASQIIGKLVLRLAPFSQRHVF